MNALLTKNCRKQLHYCDSMNNICKLTLVFFMLCFKTFFINVQLEIITFDEKVDKDEWLVNPEKITHLLSAHGLQKVLFSFAF